MKQLIIISSLVLALITLDIQGQTNAGKILNLALSVNRDSFGLGDTAIITGIISLEDGWHVHADLVDEDYLIPTSFFMKANELVTGCKVIYPQAKKIKLSFSDQKVAVFSDNNKIVASCKISESAPVGENILTFVLKYQACNDVSCAQPCTEMYQVAIKIKPSGQ